MASSNDNNIIDSQDVSISNAVTISAAVFGTTIVFIVTVFFNKAAIFSAISISITVSNTFVTLIANFISNFATIFIALFPSAANVFGAITIFVAFNVARKNIAPSLKIRQAKMYRFNIIISTINCK